MSNPTVTSINRRGSRRSSSDPALDRGLELREVLSGEGDSLTQTELAGRTGRTVSENFRTPFRFEGAGRTITETDLVVHAGHAGDFFPHHLDAEFRESSAFGQRIAHGSRVLAIGAGPTATRINPMALSDSCDRGCFVKPVLVGDTVRTRCTFTATQDDPRRPDMGRLIERIEVLNQRGDAVLVADHLGPVEKRPA